MSEVQYVHTTAIHNCAAAAEVLPHVFSLRRPRTVLDVGCGTGTWLRVAKELGAAEVQGLDGVHVDRALLTIAVDEFQQHDLTQPLALGRTYDLVICLEVAEHLPDAAAAELVRGLAAHGDFILFSAAIPNQGGQHHVNEQWPAYWQALFAAQGLYPYDVLRARFWGNERVEWWYRQNMIVYAPRAAEDWLGGPPTPAVLPLVHPGLFALQREQLEQAWADQAAAAGRYAEAERYQRAIYAPALLPSLRLVAKACLQKAPWW